MEQAVKQRLVGAAVLTALAVITIPMIFDVDRQSGVQVPETLPAPPQHPEVAMPEPKPVDLPAERPNAEPTPVGQMYQMANDPAAGESVMPVGGITDDTVRDFMPAPPPPASPASAQAAAAAPPAPPPASPAPVAVEPAPAPAPAPVPAVKLDKSGLPQGWVVQVAAMSDRKKADALVAQLKLNGHAAFTTVTREAKGDTIRVFVGPKADKAAAQRAKQQVDSELGLQTMVKPFKS